LNPNLLATEDRLTAYVREFGPGSEGRLKDPNNDWARRGREIGLKMEFGEGYKTGNTLDAHRLLHFAETRGGTQLQNALHEVLFS